jgi:hypothetical protein
LVDPHRNQTKIDEMIWRALDKYGEGPIHFSYANPAGIPRNIELRETRGGEHRADIDLCVDDDLLPEDAGCHSKIVAIRRQQFASPPKLTLIAGGVT